MMRGVMKKKLCFLTGESIQYKELIIRFIGISWTHYVRGDALRIPTFVVKHSNGSEWLIYFAEEEVQSFVRIFFNYFIEYTFDSNKKECLKIVTLKKGEPIIPKIIEKKEIQLTKGEEPYSGNLSFGYTISIESHDDFSKLAPKHEINSVKLIIVNTSEKIVKKITFGHEESLEGKEFVALFKMHRFQEYLLIWNFELKKASKGIFDFTIIKFTQFDMKFEDMVKTQIPSYKKTWIESHMNRRKKKKYTEPYEGIHPSIKQYILNFIPNLIQRKLTKRKKPIVILTVPHAKCEDHGRGRYNHTCDLLAPEAARRLREKLIKIGIQTISHYSQVNRTICDMNRWTCVNTPYRIELINKVKKFNSNQYKVFVLDVHSFPNDVFPKNELFILDSSYTGRRNTRPTKYAIHFRNYLRQKGVQITIHRAKANENSIMEQVRRELGEKSFLLEFNERLRRNPVRFDRIIFFIAEWFQTYL